MNKFIVTTIAMSGVVLLGATGNLLAAATGDNIESTAKNTYVFKTYLKGDDIKIQAANDGVVTLTGTVSEWSRRTLAEETVAGLAGVKRVDNKLTIKDGQPVENSDGWIGIKVKTMLLFHRNVSGLRTEVDVKDGIVTLRGEASSEAEKELATEYAKDVDGVKTVNNILTIEKTAAPATTAAKKPEKTEKAAIDKVGDFIDDASITAQIKVALMFHRSTSAIKTKVETKNGVVTVSGVAKNGAEKDLVGKLVDDIKGVKNLKNEMTIG
jgi:hyperosmotically inducible protein